MSHSFNRRPPPVTGTVEPKRHRPESVPLSTGPAAGLLNESVRAH